jgi:DNA-binding NarL/FixJ family response regulator
MKPNDKISVLVVDDIESHQKRIERAIEQCDDLNLLPSGSSGYEALLLAGIHKPDIILLDIEMEDKYAGITAAKEINKSLPETKIVILTAHSDDNIVFAAFQTGIVDYILKTAPTKEIIDAIRNAYRDLSPIRPIIAKKIREEFKRTRGREESLLYTLKLISSLTPSELDVLMMIANGKTRRQIASERFVELGTVKKQINTILRKCEQKRTSSLVAIMKELKIIEIIDHL